MLKVAPTVSIDSDNLIKMTKWDATLAHFDCMYDVMMHIQNRTNLCCHSTKLVLTFPSFHPLSHLPQIYTCYFFLKKNVYFRANSYIYWGLTTQNCNCKYLMKLIDDCEVFAHSINDPPVWTEVKVFCANSFKKAMFLVWFLYASHVSIHWSEPLCFQKVIMKCCLLEL